MAAFYEIYPKLEERLTTLFREANRYGIYFIVTANAYTLCTATGNLNYAASLMEQNNDDIFGPEQFDLWGTIGDSAFLLAAGEIPVTGIILAPMVDLIKAYTESLAYEESRDDRNQNLAADGSRSALNYVDFGLNLSFNPRTAQPEDYVNYETETYVTNDGRVVIDDLTRAYSEMLVAKGIVHPESAPNTTTGFLDDLVTYLEESVIVGSDNPTTANDFLWWCDSVAVLEYRRETNDYDGVPRHEGEPMLDRTSITTMTS